MQVRIRQGKGSKDRYVILAPRLLEILREYYKRVRPKTYLFNLLHSIENRSKP